MIPFPGRYLVRLRLRRDPRNRRRSGAFHLKMYHSSSTTESCRFQSRAPANPRDGKSPNASGGRTGSRRGSNMHEAVCAQHSSLNPLGPEVFRETHLREAACAQHLLICAPERPLREQYKLARPQRKSGRITNW